MGEKHKIYKVKGKKRDQGKKIDENIQLLGTGKRESKKSWERGPRVRLSLSRGVIWRLGWSDSGVSTKERAWGEET